MEGFNVENEISESLENIDKEVAKLLENHIQDLTTTGSPSLDQKVLKKVKLLCRRSDDNVRHAFYIIMKQLKRKHSEVRLSAFQIADELFNRSHAFRDILLTHLHPFLALTTETEVKYPLPPPKATAKKLKADALHAVQRWYDKYRQGYKKLAVGYDYLRTCKHIDFNDIQVQNEAERLQKEEEERRKVKVMADRLAKVTREIAESKLEIDDCMKEAESCLELLLPKPDDMNFFDDFSTSFKQENTSSEQEDKPKCSDTVINKDSDREIISNDSVSKDKKECQSCSPTIIEPDDNNINKELEIGSSGDSLNKTRNSLLNEDKLDEGSKKNKLEEEMHTGDKLEKVINDNSLAPQSSSENDDKGHNDDDIKEESYVNIIDKESNGDKLDKGNNGDKLGNGSNGDELDKGSNNDSLEKPSNHSESESDEEFYSDESDEEDLRAHGLTRPGMTITVEVPLPGTAHVKETEDNTDVVRSLREASKLIQSVHLPRVVRWLEILGKNGGKEADIKKTIDLKLYLKAIQEKTVDLKLIKMEKPQTLEKDSDDDDDFEEVPEKEGFEPRIPFHMRHEYGLDAPPTTSHTASSSTHSQSHDTPHSQSHDAGEAWGRKEKQLSLADPTSMAAAMARVKATSSDPELSTHIKMEIDSPIKKENVNAEGVPIVEFSEDLACWENPDKIEAPSIIKFDSLHRFWTTKDTEHEKPSDHDIAAVKNRAFTFAGTFEPVKWKCRAPLHDGKLCDRMDRVKCPFHGKIVARDEKGIPESKQNLPSTSSKATPPKKGGELNAGEIPPWQDPELQREIEEATGHDLGSARSQKVLDKAKAKAKGKGKGKSSKKSGLTDINAHKNTTRNRLEKKVFKKSSLKRVCGVLDNADYKRVRDKFGNQFNYSFE